MFLKKLIQALFLCGMLFGCSDQKDVSNDFNKSQNEIVSLEKKKNNDANQSGMQKGTENARIVTYCKNIVRCVDSLNTIVEKNLDSLKQTDKFKVLMNEYAKKNDSLEQNKLLSSQPRYPHPEGVLRLLIIQKLLE
ncbi:MAG: hypothetical protein HUK21_09965 [Fibrobacteraceae bacterium]|nr:hypothetical protein [Fibrobacteraceae bacterium]